MGVDIENNLLDILRGGLLVTKVKTRAILYNASSDLLNVTLQDNYQFEKRYLGDLQLIKFFDETLLGFRRKYQDACLDENLDVITVESNFDTADERFADPNFHKALMEELVTQLDRQIRLIRLVCDCTLHFSEFRYILTSPGTETKGTIPHIDRVIKKKDQPFSISDKQYAQIEECISSPYPFTNNWVWKVYEFFDSSLLFDNEVALVVLITAFEMIFLNNEREAKKERLAKRSAVYFGKDDEGISEIYEQLKLCYSDRSNYVHEGKSIQNIESKLNYLQSLLRKFILDNKDNRILTKEALIQEQISKVKNYPPFISSDIASGRSPN